MRSDPSASVYGEWRPRESLALRLTWSNGGRTQTDSWLSASPREAGRPADLDYLAATWSPPTWQARAEWTPKPLARVTFGASPGGDTRMTGHTTMPGGRVGGHAGWGRAGPEREVAGGAGPDTKKLKN